MINELQIEVHMGCLMGDNISGNNFSDNFGNQFVGGKHWHGSQGPAEPPTVDIGIDKVLPITSNLLSVVASIFAIGAGWSGFKGFSKQINPANFPKISTPTESSESFLYWILAALGFLLLMGVTIALARAIKHEEVIVPPLPFMPKLAGVETESGKNKLATIRLSGKCPICRKGQLVVRQQRVTVDQRVVNGRVINVKEMRPYAVCKRNPRRHKWEFDTTIR